MGIRNNSYGGTDWSNGQILDATDLNDTFNAVLTRTAGVFNFVSSAADTDITLNFNGTTNSGQLLWMEDEDYFKSNDDWLFNSAERIYFRDTALSISSQNDGHLDLTADSSVDINAPEVEFTSSGDITMSFLGGTNEGSFNWMEDENYFQFNDDIYMNSNDIIGVLRVGRTISGTEQTYIDFTTNVDIYADAAVNFYESDTTDLVMTVDVNNAYLNMQGHSIQNVDFIEFQGSDYIIRLEDDTDTGIYWDASLNRYYWRQNAVSRAYLDYNNGNFWTDGNVDCDGFILGSSGTYTDIADNIADADSTSIPDSTLLKSLLVDSLVVGIKNHGRQLIDRTVDYSADGTDVWGEAYVDADGRNNSVDTGSTDATFDTDKYKVVDYSAVSGPYVIIETTQDLSSISMNNCLSIDLGSDTYVIYCTTGTDEVKRAQIYKTLFYGTTGSDYLITSSVTSIKTSVTRDVGKTATTAILDNTSTAQTNGAYTGTFSDTSTNTDCSFWSHVNMDNSGSFARFEAPSGTTLNQVQTTSSNETGTDKTADELDNPATCQLEITKDYSGSHNGYVRALILHTGTISWVESGSTGDYAESNINFETTYGCTFTLAGSIGSELPDQLIYHTIPSGTFGSTISSAVGSPLVEDWETGADVQFKLTNVTSVADVNDTTVYNQGSGTWSTFATYDSVGATTPSVDVDIKMSSGSPLGEARIKFNYLDGTSFTTSSQLVTGTSYVTRTFVNTSSSKILSSVELQLNDGGGDILNATNIIIDFTNPGTDDSGYLNKDEISTFTAFTGEPTTLIVKLIPKTTSPTAGYPSIKGFALKEID